jgi:hypothetical protein
VARQIAEALEKPEAGRAAGGAHVAHPPPPPVSRSDFHPTPHSPRHGGPRSGGALNLNIHIHALVLDAVFARDAAGVVAFHAASHLATLDVAEVLAAVKLPDSQRRRVLTR